VTTPTTTSASTAGAHASSVAVVGVLSFAVFMTSLDLFIVNLAFPYISREYAGTSLGSLSWVLNGYTIVFAATLVPAGRWADRVGRRRMSSSVSSRSLLGRWRAASRRMWRC
jgi:MFS family permease